MKKYFLVLSMLFAMASVTNAAIIDHTPSESSFTTFNGLDWLDWTATMNMSSSTALSNFSGWRLATATEANALMVSAFGSSIDGANGVIGYGAAHLATYNAFENLFGLTCPSCNDSGVYAQVFGYGMIGVRDLHSNHTYDVYGFNGYNAGIYGGNSGSSIAGIALVRDASPAESVAEPASLALLGLGIVVLGIARRRQS